MLELKIGIAVSTYTEENTDPQRNEIIKKSLDSLSHIIKNTKLNVYVVLVVDGIIPKKHQELLQQYDFDIYNRKNNGGVARTKNTCIRLLLNQKVNIGFLADDDLLYKNKVLEMYVNTIIKGKINHISLCPMHPLVHPPHEWKKYGYIPSKINNMEVMKHSGNVGCWLSFTPKLIETIGYFKVMDGKYGYEHINFTHRCIYHKMIPFACDIKNSLQYLDHIGFEPIGYNQYEKNHSISEETRISENQKNKEAWKKDFHLYVDIIE